MITPVGQNADWISFVQHSGPCTDSCGQDVPFDLPMGGLRALCPLTELQHMHSAPVHAVSLAVPCLHSFVPYRLNSSDHGLIRK
jgi:hypothetical protein